jgi:hypothetical protein
MTEPYTIRIFVPDGDPEGAKIVTLMNWTGVGIAFPRSGWPRLSARQEFRRSGVYVLTGAAEGTDDDLPTVYIGQAEEIGQRIESHDSKKDFWDWGYAFVSSGNALNRAHITWLEHALIDRASKAGRCHLDNGIQPKEPGLSESERADTQGFLRELLRILPLLGVRVFEKPTAVASPGDSTTPAPIEIREDTGDTHLLARGTRVKANPPAQPVRARHRALRRPLIGLVELANALEQPVRRRIQPRRQFRNLTAQVRHSGHYTAVLCCRLNCNPIVSYCAIEYQRQCRARRQPRQLARAALTVATRSFAPTPGSRLWSSRIRKTARQATSIQGHFLPRPVS